MKQKGYWIIYPEYFDKNRSKSKGRRVAKTLAKENVSIDKLEKICKKLGYEIIIEKNKKYPANWYFTTGRILIKKVPGKNKRKILKEIAKELR